MIDDMKHERCAAATPIARQRPVDELTVLEIGARLLQSPVSAWRSLRDAWRLPDGRAALAPATPIIQPEATPALSLRRALRAPIPRLALEHFAQPQSLKLLLYALAILSSYVGSVYARGTADISGNNYYSLDYAAPWLISGFLLWLLAEVAGSWRALSAGWRRLDNSARRLWLARVLPASLWIIGLVTVWSSMRQAPASGAVGMALGGLLLLAGGGLIWLLIGYLYRRARPCQGKPSAMHCAIATRPPLRKPVWKEISHARKLLILVAAGSSLYVWQDASGNTISETGTALWALQALLWCLALAPLRWNAFAWLSGRIDALRRIRPGRHSWAILAFAFLLLLGLGFRYGELAEHPHIIVGDMVDKVRAARNIHYGDEIPIHIVGGDSRGALYHYLLVALSTQKGMNFDYFAAKHLGALCAFLTLPFMFWLGAETYAWRSDRRGFGLAAGLIALGLAAGSFWHVVLARIGMRAVITALWTAPLMIFYARGLRDNRRRDFALAGLFLGLNLISYPSSRLMPVGLVAGVLLALLLQRRSWRERASRLLNLAALAFIAFSVFLPVMRYWTEYPDAFWERSSRTVTVAEATTSESFGAAAEIIGGRFLHNWHKQLLMYHYSSDSGMWSAPFIPSVDQYAAAFALPGAAAWLAWTVRKRDPFLLSLPLLLICALAPSALTLGHPAEVPHTPRGFSAIVPSYLIAALPVALFCRQLVRCLPGILGLAAGVGFAALVILASYAHNVDYYFGAYAHRPSRSEPQVIAGQVMRAYLDSGGAQGNLFFVNYPHWLDTRAAGDHAGIPLFSNGAGITDIPNALRRNMTRGDEYRLDPDRDLLFLYAPLDADAPLMLQSWFPEGKSQYIEPVYHSEGIYIFRALAPGAERLQTFFERHAQ